MHTHTHTHSQPHTHTHTLTTTHTTTHTLPQSCLSHVVFQECVLASGDDGLISVFTFSNWAPDKVLPGQSCRRPLSIKPLSGGIICTLTQVCVSPSHYVWISSASASQTETQKHRQTNVCEYVPLLSLGNVPPVLMTTATGEINRTTNTPQRHDGKSIVVWLSSGTMKTGSRSPDTHTRTHAQ